MNEILRILPPEPDLRVIVVAMFSFSAGTFVHVLISLWVDLVADRRSAARMGFAQARRAA